MKSPGVVPGFFMFEHPLLIILAVHGPYISIEIFRKCVSLAIIIMH